MTFPYHQNYHTKNGKTNKRTIINLPVLRARSKNSVKKDASKYAKHARTYKRYEYKCNQLRTLITLDKFMDKSVENIRIEMLRAGHLQKHLFS